MTLVWIILKAIGGAIRNIWNSPHGSWILLSCLVAATLFGWHEVALHKAVDAARKEEQAKFEALSAKYQAEHNANQDLITRQAAPQNAAIDAKVTSIARDTAAIKAKLASLKPTKYATALPANCVFDDERVKDANEALQR